MGWVLRTQQHMHALTLSVVVVADRALDALGVARALSFRAAGAGHA